ncbi:MAG: hypothetical protein Q9169_005693 [Polycauliona sp. 2 TL-2023]
MQYFRRWLMNEMRRDGKGGISQQNWYALIKWSKEPESGGKVTLDADGQQAKDRFMAEWDAATKAQGRNHGLENWWDRVPSLAEKTGKPRPENKRKKQVTENKGTGSKYMELLKYGAGAENAIVIDDSDEEEGGEREMTMIEDEEVTIHGGNSRQMVLRGPRPDDDNEGEH